jgi:hypothetical protein
MSSTPSRGTVDLDTAIDLLASTDLPDGSIWAGVERVLVASSGLGRLALELPAARVSGWLPNEAPAGQGSVAAWLERGEQHLH